MGHRRGADARLLQHVRRRGGRGAVRPSDHRADAGRRDAAHRAVRLRQHGAFFPGKREAKYRLGAWRPRR